MLVRIFAISCVWILYNLDICIAFYHSLKYANVHTRFFLFWITFSNVLGLPRFETDASILHKDSSRSVQNSARERGIVEVSLASNTFCIKSRHLQLSNQVGGKKILNTIFYFWDAFLYLPILLSMLYSQMMNEHSTSTTVFNFW